MDLAVSLVNEEVEKFAADFVACKHETLILNERGSRTGANTGAFYFVQRDSLVEFAALRRGSLSFMRLWNPTLTSKCTTLGWGTRLLVHSRRHSTAPP